MATADEQIRVSDRVKRILDRRRREGESYNDVLERVLDKDEEGDFYDGFGRWSDDQAERVREQREQAKQQRKARMRQLAGDEGEDADA
jgi:predicted CopG family antitoxin